MEITAKMVKELRELTGAGMMDCKKALEETSGDIDKAVELLKERGAAKAVKKSAKVAAEGVIKLKVSDNHDKASLVEINTQTDFAAKNDKFVDLSNRILDFVYENGITSVEELNKSTFEGEVFEDYMKNQIATIGENIVVRRLATLTAGDNEYVTGYVHFNNLNGVILKAKFDSEATKEASKELLQHMSMHISAMNPDVITYNNFSDEFIQKELEQIHLKIQEQNENNAMIGKPTKELPKYGSMAQLTDEIINVEKENIKQELLAEGKPEQILDKIIPGKLAKFIEDNTLIDSQYALYSQAYVLNADKTIEEVIKDKEQELNGTIEIEEFFRFRVGEGIEKVEEDFAAEVASQMKGQ